MLDAGVFKEPGAIGVDSSADSDADYKLDFLKTYFLDNSFDKVYMRHVIEHVNDQLFIAEAYRILKPGGVLMVETPNALNISVIMRHVLRGKYSVNDGHIHTYGETEFRNLFVQAGFTNIRIRYSRFRNVERSHLINFVGGLIGRCVKNLGEVVECVAVKP